MTLYKWVDEYGRTWNGFQWPLSRDGALGAWVPALENDIMSEDTMPLTERLEVMLTKWQTRALGALSRAVGAAPEAIARVFLVRGLLADDPEVAYTNALYEIGQAGLRLARPDEAQPAKDEAPRMGRG